MNTAQHQSPTITDDLSAAISSSILKTLLYYDLFSYPLTAEEIRLHSSVKSHITDMDEALEQLCKDQYVFRFGQYYTVHRNHELVERRIKGNRAAEKVMSKVLKRSKLIAAFPFVRCICISGSLSKNYFNEGTDADFFIITEPNRLWVCRTFLILFKKLFLLNSKKYFCVNYFIDSENLTIPDKNIFTATELTTLIPVYNYRVYEKLLQANHWVKSFFPNTVLRSASAVSVSKPRIKNILEKLLRGSTGEWLDTFFMKKTLQHWQKEFGTLPAKEFEVNMRSWKNVSKHHPQGFQFQVLKRFEARIHSFELQHQLTLSHG